MIGIDASPIMGHNHLLIEALQAHLIEGSLDAVGNNREILAPLEVLLRFGAVWKIDKEQSFICELFSPVERLPNLVVVGPALHENY